MASGVGVLLGCGDPVTGGVVVIRGILTWCCRCRGSAVIVSVYNSGRRGFALVKNVSYLSISVDRTHLALLQAFLPHEIRSFKFPAPSAARPNCRSLLPFILRVFD